MAVEFYNAYHRKKQMFMHSNNATSSVPLFISSTREGCLTANRQIDNDLRLVGFLLSFSCVLAVSVA